MAKLPLTMMFLVGAVVLACVPAPGEPEPAAASGSGGAGGSTPAAGGGGSGVMTPPGSGGAPAPAAGGTAPPAQPGSGGAGPDATAPPSVDAGATAEAGSVADAGAASEPGVTPPLAGSGLAQKQLGGSIGLGYFTACHIQADKTFRCFGDRHPRTMPPGGLMPTQISCSHDGCCVTQPKEAGTRIRCWSDKRTIFPPDAVARAVDPVLISIGYQHGCVLNADSTVTCWGQPGTMNAPPAGLKAKSLHAAAYYNCAVTLDDSVVCWGINPPAPPAGLKAKLVSAIVHTGGHLVEAPGLTRHACAIKLDDTVVCWGDNVSGTTDVPANLGPVRDVGVSTYSSCALKPDGEMVCWGTRKLFPERYKAPPAGMKLKAIKGQFGAYCGLRLDDTLACWGEEKTSHITVPPGVKLFVP